ncbi:myelin-oligodendrocyte glycoprotein-like isoform X1 [Trematomus bernacchii]|uniref:myelin-oligodendrocyte glycoprotein-like isoform X1 n=2 Tax=Trematomus bernacchii TaxID=40690 RepID=UPI00146A4A5C|nr:myelin-oligodendrocyte glycoprotein-like isoform X1 [Trematomus bernacchii]
MFVLVSLVSLEGEKMIFLILLLLFLTPCVSGTFVVNVTQTSYQAEENQNITLEWTFSTRRETSLRSISTICQLLTETRTYFMFHLHQGVESPESQDPEFAGRVQWDKDVLTEGRLTLHVSRLRTNDSGFYVCDILVTPDGSNSRRCWLNVTAAEELQPQRPESWTGVWVTVGVSAAVLVFFVVSIWKVCIPRYERRTHNAVIQMESLSEEQTIRTNISPSESEHKVRLSNI